MSGLSKGVERVEARLKWDPSRLGQPSSDLDLIAATYPRGDTAGDPAYLVHFDSRSPDGTIWLNRDSKTGMGLGFDEVMTLDLTRLGDGYGRVVVGVVIQQRAGRLEFGDVANTGYQIVEGYRALAEGDFSTVAHATAATIAEFTREPSSQAWTFHPLLRGFDADPDSFAGTMGRPPS
jgi:tellurium resistance protein TerD